MSDHPGRAGSLLNDPLHWRKQAADLRKLADQSREDVRASLLKVAVEYDVIAEKAEKRLSQGKFG